MKILRSIAELASLPGPLVLAVGTFDGLHLGHQALIRHSMGEAAAVDGTAVVVTFDRHPASVVRPDQAPKLLTTTLSKLELLEQMNVPVVLLLEFNKALAAIPPEEFIRSLSVAAKPLRMICVGSQWSFGMGGKGNITLLERLGKEWGFSVAGIHPVEALGSPISSTRVRQAIAGGDFEEARVCLGRSFLLSGSVVSGAGLGSRIGFPTANLDVHEMQLPPDGVYAVKAHYRRGMRNEEKIYGGVANIGVRPTVNRASAERTVEVHLFNVSENFVGKKLDVEFIHYLRSEEKFSDLAALTAQIARDCDRAREILSE